LQWELPAALARPIGTIGDCTMPLSMMLVGSILSETRLSVLLDRQLYLFCLVRLILLPGVVFAGCLAFGVTRDIAQVCILMAGMPAATTASLLALRYGADEKLGSASMALTTILFFLLLPAWAALFRLL
ncbi:MAG: AEC family transporter, partial [Clostridiales Family XIII bacterium]|nr:AEC family transporter [Clostridiales Family XIII bacterium]